MKQQTTLLTQHYWLNVWRDWMRSRIERNEIAPPQGEEAIAALDDLNALLNLPGMPDLLALAERLPGDFTQLMADLEDLIKVGPQQARDGAPLITDAKWREVTALISLYAERWIAAAQRDALVAEDSITHVFNHQSRDEDPLLNVKVESNSRGYTWSVTVEGARSIDEALSVSKEVMDSLATVYGKQNAAIAEAARRAAEAKKKDKRGSAAAAEPDELDDLT